MRAGRRSSAVCARNVIQLLTDQAKRKALAERARECGCCAAGYADITRRPKRIIGAVRAETQILLLRIQVVFQASDDVATRDLADALAESVLRDVRNADQITTATFPRHQKDVPSDPCQRRSVAPGLFRRYPDRSPCRSSRTSFFRLRQVLLRRLGAQVVVGTALSIVLRMRGRAICEQGIGHLRIGHHLEASDFCQLVREILIKPIAHRSK